MSGKGEERAVVTYNVRCIYMLFTVIAISINYFRETKSGEAGITRDVFANICIVL